MTIGSITYSQKIDNSQVPGPVKKMFFTKVNDTLTPVWEKLGEEYQASFSKGDMKAQVVIDSKAVWQKTIWVIPYQYVPQKIKDNIFADYSGFKVSQVSIQYRSDGDFYVIEAKKKKEIKTITYSLKGELIKPEPEQEIKKVENK